MKTYLFLLLTLLLSFVNAQKIEVKFKIDSITNGSKLFLSRAVIKDYYPTEINDSSMVKNGEVNFFVDKKSFAYPFLLNTEVINKSFFSTRPFYLKDKSVTIKLNEIYDPIDNDINERKKYEDYFKEVNIEIDNYNNYFGENFMKYKFDFPKDVNDSINKWYSRNWKKEINLLEQYIKESPTAEIALWKIIEKFERYRDYPYEKLYINFDTNIKQSYPFKVLEQNIKENKTFGLGKIFPKMNNLKSLENKNYQSDYTKNKYTLIDFWFSSCKPCLATFPKLKNIYNQYHDKGFEIEAISVDTKKYIDDWKKTITKYELPWINVLDEEKKFSQSNHINSFPTSFLVNQKGEIIMKNIEPEQLEIFLKENLK